MEPEVGSSSGDRKMVDIFSHFSRLISDGQTDTYMEIFEQNNLLVNFGPSGTGYGSRPMPDGLKSFPANERAGISPKLAPSSSPNFSMVPRPSNNDVHNSKDWTPADLPPGVLNGYVGLKSESSGSPDLKRDVKKGVLSGKPKCPQSRPPMLPPCRVCGDAASGFHYGVNTCEACKGFFRRSILKSTPHACVNSGNCKMIRGRRTSCSACRFKRCLEVGMSKHAIKTGRYTHELRSKNILEVKRLQNQATMDDRLPTQTAFCGVDVTKREVSESPRMECDEQGDSSSKGRSIDRKSGKYAGVLDQLMEGQQCLYEFLDEYYDDDLMLQRQKEVYERYLRDKKRREMWERIKARDEQCAGNGLSQHSQSVSSPQHSFKNSMGEAVNSDSSSTSEWNAQYGNKSWNSNGFGNSQSFHKNSGGINSSQSSYSNMDTPTIQSSYSSDHFDRNVYAKTHDVSGTSSDIPKSPFGNDLNKTQGVSASNTDIPRAVSGFDSNFISGKNMEIPRSISSNNTSLDADEEDKSYLGFLGDPTEELKVRVLANFMEDMKRGVTGMLAFSKKVPGFSDLPDEDQVTLVQASKIDIWAIGHVRCFNSELQVGACEWRFHAEELAKVWGEDLIAMTFNMMKIGRDLDLNKEETAVLRALAFSFTDRCYPLQDRAAVEEIHEHMLSVLKETVLKRHRNFNAWFARVVRFISNLREVGTLYERISSNLILEWSVLKDNPTLLEVFMS